MSQANASKRVVQPHKKALLSRLKRIEGQVRGVSAMIESDRYCIDVVTQLAALRSAVDGVALRLLEDHAHGCVSKAVCNGDKTAVEELMKVVKRFAR